MVANYVGPKAESSISDINALTQVSTNDSLALSTAGDGPKPCKPRLSTKERLARLNGISSLCFGGDPNVGPNLNWITLEQHTELVKWWNRKYRELAP